MMSALKAAVSVRRRVSALALTDGMVWLPTKGWAGDHAALLSERVPTEAEAEAGPAAAMMRPLLSRFAAAAPHAFEEPAGRWQGAAPAEVLAAVGRNFVASDEPLGSTLHAAPHELVALSAGTLRHPDTTHAAEEAVFHFLTRGADGEAAAANDAVRAGERAWPPPPPSQRLHALLAVLAVSILLAVVAVMLRAA
mmetsp:Transcript_701/g.2232  ORF Transcript_701/g.2232 Transcript_701/m.2232 type:complete len:195 (-) Transcript_701:204-788(-)